MGQVKQLAPYQWQANDQYIKSFRAYYPDSLKCILGRYEEIQQNASEITRNFGWAIGIKVIFGDSGQSINISGVSGAAPLSYEIKKAAIYGAAKYNDTWKGCRVDKRND